MDDITREDFSGTIRRRTIEIMNARLRLLAVLIASVPAGCALQDPPSVAATEGLACHPSALRSAWWSEGGPTLLDSSADVVVNGALTHMLVSDVFRPAALRLSDGTRTGDGTAIAAMEVLAGVRYAEEAISVDAAGRHDLAGATEVLEIGRSVPVASIPWLVPRSDRGYSHVVATVSQTTGRTFLLEQATFFGGEEVGLWLRAIGADRAEQRIDLTTVVPDGSGYTLVVDEPRDVIFVLTGEQSDAPPSITRVRLDDGTAETIALELGAPAPILGHAHVEPAAEILDAAISHDGATLLVSGRDGLLRVLDAETLETTGETVRVVVQAANGDTYLPSLRSPIAFSGDDALVAVVGPEGEVVVLERATWVAVATLDSLAPVIAGTPDGDVVPSEMALRFLHDGLVVVSDAGVERFSCP